MKKINKNKHTSTTNGIRPITKGSTCLGMVSVRQQNYSFPKKSNMEQVEYPVEHLNRVQARMYRALCLGVLQIMSINNTHLRKQTDDTQNMTLTNVRSNPVQQSKSVKMNNSPVSFRFIRKIRKRSSFDERDNSFEVSNKLNAELEPHNKIDEKINLSDDEGKELVLKTQNTELKKSQNEHENQKIEIKVDNDNEVTAETENRVHGRECVELKTQIKLDHSEVNKTLRPIAEAAIEIENTEEADNAAKGQLKNSNIRRASLDVVKHTKRQLHIGNIFPLGLTNKVQRRWSDPEAIIMKGNNFLINNQIKYLNLGGVKEKLLEVGCQTRGNNTQLHADNKKLNKIILELHCKHTAHATPLAKANELVVADIDILNNNNKTTKSNTSNYNNENITLMLHNIEIKEPQIKACTKYDNIMKTETNEKTEEVMNMKEDRRNDSNVISRCVLEAKATMGISKCKENDLIVVESAIATEKVIHDEGEELKVMDYAQVSKQTDSQEQCQSFLYQDNKKITATIKQPITDSILPADTASASLECNSFEKSAEHLTTEISSASNITMPELQSVPARVLLTAKVDASVVPEDPPFNELVLDDNAKKKVRSRKNSIDKRKFNASQTKHLLPFTSSTTTAVAKFEDVALKCDIKNAKSKPSSIREKKIVIKHQQDLLTDSDANYFGEPISEKVQQNCFYGEPISQEGQQQTIGIEADDENKQVELFHSLDIDLNAVKKEEELVEEHLLKSCLKPREFLPGDRVVYAERYKRTMVRWKKGHVIERITNNSYKLDIDGKEVPAHISYIKKYTDRKVNFGGKQYLEINEDQVEGKHGDQ